MDDIFRTPADDYYEPPVRRRPRRPRSPGNAAPPPRRDSLRKAVRVFLTTLFVAMAAALGAWLRGSPTTPPGAIARCRDGSYSWAKSHSGACSSHGGVREFYR